MDDKKVRITYPTKNTLLFVLNSIYDKDVSQTLTKTKLIKKMSELYSDEINVLKLTEILSVDSYKKLEVIYNDYLNGIDPSISFMNNETNDLIDTCIFYLEETKYADNSIDIKYVYNPIVFKNLGVLFSDKGKDRFKKEELFENVIIGLNNIYGVIKMDYFVSLVNNYLNINYDEDALLDKLLIKLKFNQRVNNFTINWKNIGETDHFFTFFEYDDEIGRLCESQKQINFQYNIYDLEEVIKRSYKKYDNYTYEVISKLKNSNHELNDEYLDEFVLNSFKGSEKAVKELDTILSGVKDEKDDLLEMLALWHNNIGLYPLCGNSIDSMQEESFVS